MSDPTPRDDLRAPPPLPAPPPPVRHSPSSIWLPRAARERLKGILEHFETAWRRGERPAIEDFLATSEAERRGLLFELVHGELEFRLHAGEVVRVEAYLEKFPELRADPEAVIALIGAECEVRRRRGETPAGAEYLARFPEYAELLKRTLPAPASALPDIAEATTLPPEPAASGGETRAPSPSTLPLGKDSLPPRAVVPGYEILGILGKGGMGIVYKARQVGLCRVVALKMILHSDHAGPSDRQRFKVEAEAVARLQHPHIVQVFEIGEHDDMPFLALEYCGGGSLEQKLDGTPWEASQAAALVETLAQAMHAAHQAQVVHRDLKPANVLLTGDGQAKVTDFGLARKLDEKHRTQTGAVLGTPSYMAPEQASGQKEVGPAADVYALGAILYELLTGRPPFKGPTALETVLQVVTEEPVPVRSLVPRTPRDLETICHKCLQKDLRKRYSDAAALAEDLRRFRMAEPIAARPVGVPERMVKWARRRPALASLAAVIVLAVAGLVGGGLWFTDRLADERDQARQAKADAEHSRDVARKEENDHKLAEERALAEKRHAEQERDRADRLVYAGQLTLAYREWQDNNVSHARTLLDNCRPDFRHWEHAYLRRLCDSRQRTFSGHNAEVNAVCFSPDGKCVASVSGDGSDLLEPGEVRLWDAATGATLRSYRGHADRVNAVCFSPDGKYLATASADRTVRIWDVAGEGEAFPAREHVREVNAVAFSPDGKRLASVSQDGTVKVWEVAGGREILSLQADGSGRAAVVFSPDGHWLAARSGGGAVQVWDSASGARLHGLGGLGGQVPALAVRPDGGQIAAAAEDGTVKLWDAATGHEDRVFQVEAGPLRSLAYSPDGRRLAFACGDTTVQVYGARGDKMLTFKGHKGAVTAVAFSPEGRRLASASADATVRVWDVLGGQDSLTLPAGAGPVRAVAFNSKGTRLAGAASDRTVRVWDPIPGEELLTLRGHSREAQSVAFSPDGTRLASTAGDQVVRLWDAATGRNLLAIDNPTSRVRGIAFSPDGRFLAAPAGDKSSWVMEMATGQIFSLGDHARGVTATAFSSDGRRLASASADQTVAVWDVRTRKNLATLRGHTGPVNAVAFEPGGTQLVSGSDDATVRVWDVSGEHPPRLLEGHRGAVYAVAYSPDALYLASAGRDGTVRIWDAVTGQSLHILEGHVGAVTALAFSHVGQRLASAAEDGMLKVWDVTTEKMLLSWQGHATPASAVVFSPDDARLASGSDDRTVVIWDTSTGDKRLSLEGHTAAVTALAWSTDGPEGARLASVALDHEIRVWDGAGEVPLWRQYLRGSDARRPLAFSPDGRKLAGAGEDTAIKVWDSVTGKTLATLEGHNETVTALACSPDGVHLASGAADGAVKMWDITQGREVRALAGHTSPVTAVVFDRTGQRLASASADQTVRVWQVATNDVQFTLKGHTQAVSGVCFSADGKRIVTSSDDKTVKIWDGETGQELLSLKAGASDTFGIAFSADDRRLALAADGAVKVLDATVEADFPAEEERWRTRRALAWHEQQARAAEQGRMWFAAAFHLRQLLELEPKQAALHARLGQARLQLGSRAQAAEELVRALQLDRTEPQTLSGAARLCLDVGDVPRYHRTCASLLEALAAAGEQSFTEHMLRTLLLVPEAVADQGPVLRRARQELVDNPESYTARALYAKALLRAGRFAEAIEQLQQALSKRPRTNLPREELLLAIAYHHDKQEAEARRQLEQAAEELDRAQAPLQACLLVGAGSAGPMALLPLHRSSYELAIPGQDWMTCLELRCLRREAEALLGSSPPGGDSKAKQDPSSPPRKRGKFKRPRDT
jgi:WD40 repeat protein/Flp pilus assembly protein TadD